MVGWSGGAAARRGLVAAVGSGASPIASGAAQVHFDRRPQLDQRVIPLGGRPAVDHRGWADRLDAPPLVDVAADDQRRLGSLDVLPQREAADVLQQQRSVESAVARRAMGQYDVSPRAGHLRADFARLTYALALSELYAATIEEDDLSGAEALPLLEASLEALSVHPEPGIALVWAEAKLLEWSGFQPSWLEGVESPQELEQRDHWFSPVAGGLLAGVGALYFVFPVAPSATTISWFMQ